MVSIDKWQNDGMDSFGEFLMMGGYARYVWPAYLIAVVVLLANAAAARRRRLRALQQTLRRGK